MIGAGLLPAAGVEDAERALREACGITLTDGLRATLAEALRRAARTVGVEAEEFLSRLRARDARCIAELVEAAVVGETYFFRHPEQLEALREVLLAAAPRDRPLSVWSAGCATGEEPYSLAMLLRDAGRAGCQDRVLGTDVSARALAVAAAAAYGPWSLRRLDPAARARHFEGEPPEVRVRAEVRAAVELRRQNLYSDAAPPGPFDLVVCRNVLIYFDPETARAIASRLFDAVAPGGILLLGPVEVPIADRLAAERLEVGGTTLLRRPRAGARPAPRPARSRGRASGPTPTPTSTPTPPPPPAPFGTLEAVRPDQSRRTSKEIARRETSFEEAREAARRGEIAFAEQLAREVAERHGCPESHLLVAMAADARGDVGGAIDALRRALVLEPGLAMAHAALVPLYARLGRSDLAARARRSALEAVAGLDDGATLRGVEPITAGALRSALEDPRRALAHAGRSET